MLNVTNHQGSGNQNPLILKWLLSKNQEITSVGVDVKKREFL
jgi:hypothetical protein